MNTGMNTLTRRELLAQAARWGLVLGLGGAVPARLLAADASASTPPLARRTATSCIYIWCAGGMSHLDTFDPKPGTSVAGPVQAIATAADGIQLSQYLPLLAKEMRDVALIRSLTSNQGAHEQGDYFMHTSYQMRGTARHPALGAWASRLGGDLNPALPAYVTIAAPGSHPGCGFLPASCAPLPIGNPAGGLQNAHAPVPDRQARRLALLHSVNQTHGAQVHDAQVTAYQQTWDEAVTLMGSRELEAFDISKEPERLRRSYGDDPFAQGLVLARRLVERDVRFIDITLGGWDTHNDNFERVEERAAILDRGLAALLADLRGRGLLDETLVVVATEFGRTPTINQNQGRDHHPRVFSGLLAGGGIRGGQVHGASSSDGSEVAEKAVSVPDFNATIAAALGLPIDQVITAPDGRPFTVADRGVPVKELLA